jgi:hypothetical protein
MVEDDEGGGEVLSSQEQRIWDDVQRYWAEEAEEPLGPAPSGRQEVPRDESDPPTAVVAGAWITITLVFVGAMTAALTVAIATALGWALWHNWPRLSRLWQMKQSLGGPLRRDPSHQPDR